MLKFLKDKKKDNKGFTLVELVIVVAILAIVVGILAPQYTKYVERSRKAADASNMDELIKAVQVYSTDHAIGAAANTTGTAKEITIALTSNGVTYGTDTDAKAAFDEYVPNYTSIKLKSQKWGGDPTVVLACDADGAVKIKTVSPAAFKEYLGEAQQAESNN